MGNIVYLFFLILVGATTVLLFSLNTSLKLRWISIVSWSSLLCSLYLFACCMYIESGQGCEKEIGKNKIVYIDRDHLLRDDCLILFEDKTFHIEYRDHCYKGHYVKKDNMVTLSIDPNVFYPLRFDFPSVIKIVDGRSYNHETGEELI